jgi:hypothetical protein
VTVGEAVGFLEMDSKTLAGVSGEADMINGKSN